MLDVVAAVLVAGATLLLAGAADAAATGVLALVATGALAALGGAVFACGDCEEEQPATIRPAAAASNNDFHMDALSNGTGNPRMLHENRRAMQSRA